MNWIKVSPDNLPLVNQEILYVVDYRGSPEELQRRLFNEVARKNKKELLIPIEYYRDAQGVKHPHKSVELFRPFPDEMVFVKHGWVHERYPDCFTTRTTSSYIHWIGTTNIGPEYITHWANMPSVPVPDPFDEEEAVRLYTERIKAMQQVNLITDKWSNEDFIEYQKQHSISKP